MDHVATENTGKPWSELQGISSELPEIQSHQKQRSQNGPKTFTISQNYHQISPRTVIVNQRLQGL